MKDVQTSVMEVIFYIGGMILHFGNEPVTFRIVVDDVFHILFLYLTIVREIIVLYAKLQILICNLTAFTLKKMVAKAKYNCGFVNNHFLVCLRR